MSWVVCNKFWKGQRKCFIEFTFNVQNIGDEAVDDTLIKFYLSKDNSFDQADTLIGEASVRNIMAGTGGNISLKNRIQEIGPYDRLIAVIDPTDSLPEKDGENNIVISSGIN